MLRAVRLCFLKTGDKERRLMVASELGMGLRDAKQGPLSSQCFRQEIRLGDDGEGPKNN